MNSEGKKQVVALTAACFHDWLLELPIDQLKAELDRFNKVSGGVLASARNILILQNQVRKEN